ncbi:hypothetical protein [Aquimarina algiphila]|uniref:Uncharacterized protein n=1 Tax=Aquimarina algiphila TaxID=2047982 RepID=A0A554VQZ5_9FLAO|nr:hypothetical protein [Aquimarina algiphila]TSE11029.1 hypothetical protein FOF46_02045 [Aquimarina algiphila]
MKQFVYIIISTLVFACAKAPSKELDMEASETIEALEEDSRPIISENEAYIILITQKLQEFIDKETLEKSHPDFSSRSKQNSVLSIKDTNIKEVNFIGAFQTVSDSIKTVKTEVVFATTIDTIITTIKTSNIEIEGELLKTTKITFDTIGTKSTSDL